MRSSILWWSAGGGAILGLIVGLGLVALGALLLPLVLPATVERALERHAWLMSGIVIVTPVLTGAILGYLEGRLKLD